LIVLEVHCSSVFVGVHLELVHHVLVGLRNDSNQEVHQDDSGHELVAEPDRVN